MTQRDGMPLHEFASMIGITMEKPMKAPIQNKEITSTTITVTTNYGTHTITVPAIDLDAIEMVNELFAPIMRSMGFTEETIQAHLGVEA